MAFSSALGQFRRGLLNPGLILVNTTARLTIGAVMPLTA